ncbi:DUF6292 family protein [Amycolatopsis mongoliensis]|uniref:DUF6292 family protein n=1 Tax=Amycolatopsis mongoliensis TaxID=715475 RepID=A0A9Y2JI00_9PSEU|nr:DUF6292 family protein [Amycolatopsis sp. 4-36]WIX98059.1 DUF6292 family protein [Amycolatopsis sp. 4-36]
MKPDPEFTEAAALRDYVETVARLLLVEPAASWSAVGTTSTAYIALSQRSPRHPGRLLMAQWTDGTGWCLALEPERGEAPLVLAAWPELGRPEPAVVARRVLTALGQTTGKTEPDMFPE